MSRLQKKCFIGATSLHGLLLLALVVGPGFFTEKEMPSEPMIEIVTDRATDAINPNPGTPGSSQGAPPPPTPALQVQQRQPTPEPEPPRPTPPRVERVVQREEVEPPKPTRTQDTTDSDKPTKKPTIKISDTKVKLTPQRVQTNNRNTANADAQAKADAKAAAKRAEFFAKAGERIGSGISSSTTIKLDGPVGNGGAGLANYGQIVRKRYTDAWVMPTDLTDDEATIEVTVTIRRDGTVLSARIVDSTGSRLAANSIQRTLDRVTSIGVPFPDGATESQRTFTMTFSLKAKKSLG